MDGKGSRNDPPPTFDNPHVVRASLGREIAAARAALAPERAGQQPAPAETQLDSPNQRIVEARASGLSWATIAARFHLSERQCREIWSANRSHYELEIGDDPLEPLDTLLAQYDFLIEEAARIRAAAQQDSVRLGALRTQVALVEKKAELMYVVGMLPTFEEWSDALDTQRLAETLWQAVIELGLDRKAIERIGDAWQAASDLRKIHPRRAPAQDG